MWTCRKKLVGEIGEWWRGRWSVMPSFVNSTFNFSSCVHVFEVSSRCVPECQHPRRAIQYSYAQLYFSEIRASTEELSVVAMKRKAHLRGQWKTKQKRIPSLWKWWRGTPNRIKGELRDVFVKSCEAGWNGIKSCRITLTALELSWATVPPFDHHRPPVEWLKCKERSCVNVEEAFWKSSSVVVRVSKFYRRGASKRWLLYCWQMKSEVKRKRGARIVQNCVKMA